MIIYVEDNVNNQRLMQRMLQKERISCEVFDTAEAGFKAILEKQPTLIFIDLHLKTRTNGLDLVRSLREAEVKTPIIIVTVFSMIADRKKALEAGCTDYLAKPFTLEALLSVISRYSSKSSE